MPRLEIQFLVPLITHSSPSSTAVVFIPAGSDPASGSDSANAGDHSPEAHLRQEALLQLVGAVQLDRQRAELLHHQDQRAGRVDLGDLLDRHVQHQRARARAAVLGRKRQPEDVLLAQQLADVPRVLGLLVDLGRARRDLLARDLADRLTEVEVLLGDRVDVLAEGLAWG